MKESVRISHERTHLHIYPTGLGVVPWEYRLVRLPYLVENAAGPLRHAPIDEPEVRANPSDCSSPATPGDTASTRVASAQVSRVEGASRSCQVGGRLSS